MDGTTAGRLSLNPLIPQPTPSSAGNLTIGNPTPVSPQPVTQNPAPQPQYSQLTPVYAPTPTNTPADIPQPAVKGIEFIKPSTQVAPVSAQPAPIVSATPVQQPVAPKIQAPAPIVSKPASMPTPTVVNIPPVPVLPTPRIQTPTPTPAPAPVVAPAQIAPVAPAPPQVNPISAPKPVAPVAPPAPISATSTSYSAIQEAENQIEDVDLDQMMGTPKETVAPASITPEPVSAEPISNASQVAEEKTESDVKDTTDVESPQVSSAETEQVQAPEQAEPTESNSTNAATPTPATNASNAANYYFQNSLENNHDIPLVINASRVQRSTIIRIAMIVAAVIIIGVGAFLVWGAINSGQKQQAVPTTTTTTDQETTSTVNEPDFATPEETTTTETTTTPETTTEQEPVVTTETTTTPVQAAQAPAVTTPTVTAPASTNVTTTTPSVPDSGISDSFASLPKTLTIDKLSINAPIEQVGLTNTGAIGVPASIWNAGWYIGSVKPGEKGAAFIDGHSSSSRGALFGNLDTLKSGDKISVTRNDGVKLDFHVINIKVVNRHDVDMASMLKPYGKYARGLNIMSCIGNWIESEKTLENRVLVYAVQS